MEYKEPGRIQNNFSLTEQDIRRIMQMLSEGIVPRVIKRFERKVVVNVNGKGIVLSSFKIEKTFSLDGPVEEKQEYTIETFSCGHPANAGIGIVCHNGHAVCIACTEKFVMRCYVCNAPLCMQDGCEYEAYEDNGVLYCRRHKKGFFRKLIEVVMAIFRSREDIENENQRRIEEYRSRAVSLPYPHFDNLVSSETRILPGRRINRNYGFQGGGWNE